jgi:hypothetical protein
LGFEALLFSSALVFEAFLETLALDENARRKTGHFIFTNSGRG